MNLSYSGDICVDIKFSFGQSVEERRNIRIGRIPIMLGSSRCHLHELKERELCKLKECPFDPKGYFIVRGT
jgi:DNA-directed RNA polymerase III subunit RPC2